MVLVVEIYYISEILKNEKCKDIDTPFLRLIYYYDIVDIILPVLFALVFFICFAILLRNKLKSKGTKHKGGGWMKMGNKEVGKKSTNPFASFSEKGLKLGPIWIGGKFFTFLILSLNLIFLKILYDISRLEGCNDIDPLVRKGLVAFNIVGAIMGVSHL